MKKEDPPASLVAMNYYGGSITLNIHLSSCSVKHTPKNLCHHPSQAKRLTQCQTCFEIPFLRVQAQLIRVIYGDYDRLSDKYCNPETNSLHLYHKKNNPLQFQLFFFFLVVLRMAWRSTKSKFIFVKCLSSLTYEEAITYLTILISSHKKMVKKRKKEYSSTILLFC